MKTFLISMACLMPLTSALAQNNPTPLTQDERIKQVVYRENDVVPVHGIPFTTTQIQFADKEEILDIEGGDTTAWMVTYHPELSNIVFVKPTQFGSDTNMTVMTNKHAYYFHLLSSKNLSADSKQQTYALKFTYAEVKPKPVAQLHSAKTPSQPKVVNTAYRFSGSPQLVPLHVFDDGRFTYF